LVFNIVNDILLCDYKHERYKRIPLFSVLEMYKIYKTHLNFFFISFVLISATFSVLLAENFPFYTSTGTERLLLVKRDWINSEIIKKDNNKKIIVAVGASKIATGFLPNFFGNDTYEVFNLSVTGFDATRQLFLLKDFIKSNGKPDFIIWNPSYKREIKHSLLASDEELDYLYKKTGDINFLIDKHFPYLPSKIRLNAFFKNHVLKQYYDQEEIIENMILDRGTYYFKGDKYESIGKNYSNAFYDLNKEHALPKVGSDYFLSVKEFIQFCASLDINIFVVTPPLINDSRKPGFANRGFYEYIENNFSNVKISDIAGHTFYDSELSFDGGHLNYNGAILYTKDIWNSFKRSYSINLKNE